MNLLRFWHCLSLLGKLLGRFRRWAQTPSSSGY